jgi:hypothetical protein
MANSQLRCKARESLLWRAGAPVGKSCEHYAPWELSAFSGVGRECQLRALLGAQANAGNGP